MAMNKAEKELVEELKLKNALRWTAPVNPDVPIPESCTSQLSLGWLPIAAMSDSARVESACSSAGSHGVGSWVKTSSQQPRALYSTKLLALKALRYQVECNCAKLLRRIDAMIEQETE
jgi:hypothetical protein